MTHRSTFSLDEATILRIKQLSQLWHLSQAAVLRKVIEATWREELDSETPLQQLEEFLNQGGVAASEADLYLDEVAEARRNWRREE